MIKFLFEWIGSTFLVLIFAVPLFDTFYGLDKLQDRWWPKVENCEFVKSAEKPGSRKSCGANCALVIVAETFQCPARQIVLERPWKLDLTNAE